MLSVLRELLIKAIIPIASWWVARQEQQILRDGIELTEEEKEWAQKAGVTNVDRVRVLHVPKIRVPFVSSPIGLAAHYGICINQKWSHDPSLLVHELAHIGQYERLGGIKPFLYQYFTEVLRDGYENAAMEFEAREAALPYNRPPDYN